MKIVQICAFYNRLRKDILMFITKECCKKPAITVHMKDDYTLSVAAVSVIAALIVFHICMCKMSCMRKNKIKLLKKEAKTSEEQTSDK